MNTRVCFKFDLQDEVMKDTTRPAVVVFGSIKKAIVLVLPYNHSSTTGSHDRRSCWMGLAGHHAPADAGMMHAVVHHAYYR